MGQCPSRRVSGTWVDPNSWFGCWLPRGGCVGLGRLVLGVGVFVVVRGRRWQSHRHVEGAFAVVVAGVVAVGVVWELVVKFAGVGIGAGRWVVGSRSSSEVGWVRHGG